ncbi:retrovirus-related pol polyprotein from transposon TNT 1-94, partial [Tanacetum coccineum]
ASSSKALISNNHFQESDSDVEEDQRTSNEFMADLNVEYHERALLANQNRFYKRSGRVGSARKPIDKSKQSCFSYGKLGKYKGLKAKMVVLTKRIDDLKNGKSKKGNNEKGSSKKGLIDESFDWDKEFVSSEDEGTTKIKEFMAIAKDEPSVGKADARSGQWVEITKKKVHRLLSMTDGDERKDVLDYTHVDLCYVEDQRKNLVNKFNLLKQELSLHSKVTLDQLLFEQVPGNIVKALGGIGKRKEKISSKEVIFNKVDESSSMSIPKIAYPPLLKLIRAKPAGISNSLISLADLTLDTSIPKKTKPTSNKVSPTHAINKKTKPLIVSIPEKKAEASVEHLLLTLIEEVKSLKEQIKVPSDNSPSVSQSGSSKSSEGKETTWFGPCKHCGFYNHLAKDCYLKLKCSTYESTDYWTKEHLEQTTINKTLTKLKAQSVVNPLVKKDPMIPKPFQDCIYYRFNDHHYNNYEYYPRCEICGSIAHEIDDCPKKHPSSRKPRITNKRSTKPIEKVAYMNGLKHNLISISHLYDANFKVLFTKIRGTIFNQNDEVILIAPRRRDVYVIDMTSYNEEINTYFFTKASLSMSTQGTADCIMSFMRKMENLNEVKINELRSDNGTKFRNYKLEEFCDEQNDVAKKQNRTLIEAARTISIIVKRHGKIADDVFRGRSPNISYFHMFGCPMHIRNHKDHLGKFDENADDGFFLGYSLVAKAFRVFNIRRQEMEETCHVLFSEDDEAISQSSTEGDAINFNENRSFPNDEFLKPRSKDSISLEEPLELNIADDHLHSVNKIILDQLMILNPLIFKTIWSREKHIELVNIIGEPLDGITMKSRIRGLEAALAHECMYVNFLSEMEPKKLTEAMEEEGWIIAIQEELTQFRRNKEKSDYEETFALATRLEAIRIFLAYATYMDFMVYEMDVKSAFLNGKISKDVYQANPKESHLVAVKRIFKYLKGTPNLGLWYPKGLGFDLKAYSDSDYVRCNLDRKSTSRGCQILGEKLVCWSAKKQSSVAMSSANAKYVAAAGCCAQVLWIKSQLADYDVLYDKCHTPPRRKREA